MASTHPQELILRQDRAFERGVTTRRSQIFGDQICGDGFFCRTFAPSHCRLCCGPGLALPLASKTCSRLALAYVIGRINEENEPFSTAERSERVENFLFRATREYAKQVSSRRPLPRDAFGANSPEPRRRAVTERHVITQKTSSYITVCT